MENNQQFSSAQSTDEVLHTEAPQVLEPDLMPAEMRAQYDNKRFPKQYLAMLAVASMWPVCHLAVLLLQVVTGGQLASLFRTEFGTNMYNYVLSQFFAVLIIPLFAVLITKKDMRATFRLTKNIDIIQILLLVAISIGIFFLAQQINSIFIMFLQNFLGDYTPPSSSGDPTNIGQLLFEIVIVCGLPAICEEIFFRGFVMRAFERKNAVVAIIISAVIFGIMHSNFTQLAYALFLGIILGLVVQLTDSLLSGMVVHFCLNLFTTLLSYPAIYPFFEKLQTDYTLLFSAVVLNVLPLVAAGAIVLFVIYTRKRNKRLYNSVTASEMKYPALMPKQRTWEKVLTIIGWVLFVVINVYYMFQSW